jgi:hypothetical protein
MKDWHFPEIGIADSPRNPHDNVYFKGTDKSEAIVREFIQNALDAKKKDADKVKVRITLGRNDTESLEPFIGNLDNHLRWSGFNTESYQRHQQRYMIVEDFGTTGLTGQHVKKRVDEHTSSNFYSFWWEEGLSGKDGADKSTRGSWGLGKTTNHMASDIMSFWGLTVREDDGKELLMGKSMLSPHWHGDTQYNYGGRLMNDDGSPIKEPDIIDEFKEVFPVTRDSNESGFSVVIPFLDKEIKHDKVVKSAIIHYTLAIMMGELTVEVVEKENGEEETTVIENDSIEDIAAEYSWDDLSWKNKDVMNTLLFCREAVESFSNDDQISLEKYKEISAIEDREDYEDIKEQFNSGELVSFDIPITLHPKSGKKVTESFSVVLKKYPDREIQPDEFYVREGMLLPDESNAGLANRSVRGILVADTDELSRFLAGAEEPAHEKWNERMEKYKAEYDNATTKLRFVRNSLSDLISVLDETGEERLEGVLDDVFSIPKKENDSENEGQEKESDSGKGESEPDEKITTAEPKVRTNRTDNGFEVKAVKDDSEYPEERRIRMAYDTGSSNPFGDHEPFDFDLTKGDLTVEENDVEITEKGPNWVKFRVLTSESYLKIEGFDTNRDLRVSL